MYDFSVDYNTFDTNNNIDIRKYLMLNMIKIMFKLTRKMFIGLLTSMVSTSDHTECILLSN